MMRALAELATGRDAAGAKLSGRERARLLAQARAVEHRPPEKLDLTYEHDLSLLAIENIHRALHRVYEIALEAIFAQALAGGAVLALVAHAMIPVALEEGGSLVVLPTVAGFLFALYLTLAESLV